MIAPGVAFQRFTIALALGAGLGLFYGFLRPIRPRHSHLSDLIFLFGVGWAWLYLSFAVCRGDLRLGYHAGLLCGGFLWEMTVGRLLRPVFFGFWRLLERILRCFTTPIKGVLKKIPKYLNFLLASAKKKGTIKCNIRRHPRQKQGGTRHGKTEEPI